MKKLLYILLFLVFADSAWGATVRITWDANTEPDVSGYKLYYGTASGGPYTTSIDVGNVTSYMATITPLVGTDYYFVLTAYDSSKNESPISDEVNVFVPDSVPPAKPTGIKVIIQKLIAWLKQFWG